MTFAPDPGAAASQAPDLKNAFDYPSVNRANTMAAPDPPLQSPAPLSTTDLDVAVAGPSPLEQLSIEHIVDHTPHRSHLRDDIV